MRSAAAALKLRTRAGQQVSHQLAVGGARLQLVFRKALQPHAHVLPAPRGHPVQPHLPFRICHASCEAGHAAFL